MGELKVGKMVLGMVETNCYFVYDADTKNAVVIDPAKKGLYDKLSDNGLKVSAILLTHGHFDHIMGVHELTKLSGAKVYALKEEVKLCGDADLNASSQIRIPYTVEVEEELSDGQEFEIAGIKFKVLATPGHTEGSCCYYIESEKWLFTGDTLFCGSIGRTDLPTGDGKKIMESVHMLIDTFDEDVKVYPGHGDSSTIGSEKAYNPFCA